MVDQQNGSLCQQTVLHWMDTRLRTRMRAGGCCLHYQQFDSSTDTDGESSDVLLSSAQVEKSEKMDPALPQETSTTSLSEDVLFSEHEVVEGEPYTQGSPPIPVAVVVESETS